MLQLYIRNLVIEGSLTAARTFSALSGIKMIKATQPLCAEPMKKKKKIDTGIIINREVKRRKKLEKAVKKQEQQGLILKPIEEIEGDRDVLKTLDMRQRPRQTPSFEESERRALLVKAWSRYRRRQFVDELQ